VTLDLPASLVSDLSGDPWLGHLPTSVSDFYWCTSLGSYIDNQWLYLNGNIRCVGLQWKNIVVGVNLLKTKMTNC